MPHSFHKNVSVDSIFFFAKCYHCLGEAYSVTESILIYFIETLTCIDYITHLFVSNIRRIHGVSAYCGEKSMSQ